MVSRCTGLALALALLGASAASGQVYYNGWNTGPDYRGMLEEQLRKGRDLDAQLVQQQAAMVEQAMRDPECWAMYQQFGRGMSYPEFAYQYLATAHFTSEGIARWRQSEAENRVREGAALRALRAAQAARGEAQIENWDEYFSHQSKAGLGLQGQGSYGDPTTGGPVVLQNIRPGVPSYDQRTGRWYSMDERGNYYGQGPDGRWYPMTPEH